jgi:hypothetical protein
MSRSGASQVRFENINSRLDKHDEIIEKIGEAQTEMMVSIAKLHSSVKILLLFMAANIGVNFTGLV